MNTAANPVAAAPQPSLPVAVAPAAQAQQAPAPQPSLPVTVTPAQPAAPVSQGMTYTVKSGDTLSEIAERHHIVGGWPALYAANRDVVENPDLIFPGEVLRLP
ncbi:LysM peptidoglycan-binding domain-containing protein [Kocuria sp.]|uniref:LysM peptidoglycan-binding domain-containing protein n=1 Tax=Kocuria sp. TaxID=1871328 RepID=UPI0028A7E765|nr:LysM peptidoglycan-binding domain-containing protein [Kocuria sp.]